MKAWRRNKKSKHPKRDRRMEREHVEKLVKKLYDEDTRRIIASMTEKEKQQK